MPREAAAIDRLALLVQDRLRHKPDTSPLDVYVWADGTVSGPPGSDERRDERAIAVFSPSEEPALDDIRLTIARGFATVDKAEADVVAAAPPPGGRTP